MVSSGSANNKKNSHTTRDCVETGVQLDKINEGLNLLRLKLDRPPRRVNLIRRPLVMPGSPAGGIGLVLNHGQIWSKVWRQQLSCCYFPIGIAKSPFVSRHTQ
jgi:hypothetical protein